MREAIVQTLLVLRPGGFLRGWCSAQRIEIGRLPVAIAPLKNGFADNAPLSRILAELLGGTRSSPPEAPSRRDRLGNDERANLQFSI